MDSILVILACVVIGWSVASIIASLAVGRWLRWLRGDFDR